MSTFRGNPHYERHARDYLDWEVALLEQIKRDPTVEFRDYS